MKTKLLTDVELRARWSCNRADTYFVEEGTILTPSAQDFLRENRITLQFIPSNSSQSTMSRAPLPTHSGKAYYVNTADGSELSVKPEEMTHLRSNLLIPKTHPQIAFRGKLDSLMADIMEVQLLADELGEKQILAALEELMDYVQKILGAEVKDEPLAEISLMGLDSAGIRYASHNVKESTGIDHPIPNYRMGRMCVALNKLRTEIREAELSAARAFFTADNICTRKDIIEGLNRLSSCVYILFCRKLGGYYDRRSEP